MNAKYKIKSEDFDAWLTEYVSKRQEEYALEYLSPAWFDNTDEGRDIKRFYKVWKTTEIPETISIEIKSININIWNNSHLIDTLSNFNLAIFLYKKI